MPFVYSLPKLTHQQLKEEKPEEKPERERERIIKIKTHVAKDIFVRLPHCVITNKRVILKKELQKFICKELHKSWKVFCRISEFNYSLKS